MQSYANVPHRRDAKQCFEQRVSHNGDKCAWSVNKVSYFYPSSIYLFSLSDDNAILESIQAGKFPQRTFSSNRTGLDCHVDISFQTQSNGKGGTCSYGTFPQQRQG